MIEVLLRIYRNILSLNYFFISLAISSVSLLPFFIYHRYKKVWIWLYFGIFYIPNIIDVIHIYMFGGSIDTLAIKAVLDTNFQEVTEFVANFSDFHYLVLIFSITAIAYLLVQKIIRSKISAKINHLWIILFFLGFGASCFIHDKYKPTLVRIILACKSYYQEQKFIIFCKQQRTSLSYGPITSHIPKNIPQTYVIIIGESANKEHLSLYGYHRKTTPLCDKIKNELYIFDNVQSAHCQTLEVLKEALSLDEFSHGDVISFFKKAGFKTFWLSSQFNGGHFDNLIAVIAQQADLCKFIAQKDTTITGGQYLDELLIPHFENALKDPALKKVIFLHLLGSHSNYHNRYPNRFQYFNDYSSKTKRLVSEYDNSIAYTDFIIYECIKLLKTQNTCSFLLYFSDHGEDVRDAPDCVFFHSDALSMPSMFSIPFFVWISNQYHKLNEKFVNLWNTHQYYKTDNLTHSILLLSRLKNQNINKNKSLFKASNNSK